MHLAPTTTPPSSFLRKQEPRSLNHHRQFLVPLLPTKVGTQGRLVPPPKTTPNP
jgi:hypothetical protein